MKRDKTALKMICNQWVGSSNLSSGTTQPRVSEKSAYKMSVCATLGQKIIMSI